MKQKTLSSLAYDSKKKQTKREKFLKTMELVIPWGKLLKAISPYYAKSGNGRQPIGLEKMLRIYFLQQWYGLSDPGAEEALYDSESMRRFVGIELSLDVVPDETTILNFRHLLESKDLTNKIFSEVREYLYESGMLVQEGTIMDATIIKAPTSTKNQERKRDEEMSSTKKGNQWYFGMKAHVGTDTKSRVAHTVVCTAANVHDSVIAEDLVTGEEVKIYGDKAYTDANKKQQYESMGVKWCVSRKAKKGTEISDTDKAWNKRMNKVRARGEHIFLVVKRIFGYTKTRYKGLEKNSCQLFTLFALANLYLVRGKLLKLHPATA